MTLVMQVCLGFIKIFIFFYFLQNVGQQLFEGSFYTYLTQLRAALDQKLTYYFNTYYNTYLLLKFCDWANKLILIFFIDLSVFETLCQKNRLLEWCFISIHIFCIGPNSWMNFDQIKNMDIFLLFFKCIF